MPGSICIAYKVDDGLTATTFDCPPNMPLSAMNMTAAFAACYTWVIASQNLIAIINQLAICSSILTLLGLIFRFLSRLAAWKRWGACCIPLIGLGLLALLLICFFVLKLTIAFLDLVLLTSSFVLLVNTLLLVVLVPFSNAMPQSNRVEPIDTPGVETKLELE